ncbi:MAG: hypothetical protein M3R46_02780 [Actinomycetota bacterium]|nr:hypothetical protein [Actinomycetota bacterium]MDQ3263723.1 hypothetical protein [Myxococcota bacterium]
MAVETIQTNAPAPTVHVTTEAATSSPTLRWSAIFGGAVSALGIWALLYAFGLALGLSTVNPNDPGSIKSSGIFTGVWSLVTPLIALFVGGMVASRGTGLTDRAGGALHGLVVWGVAVLLGAYLVMNLISSIVGGVASAGKAAAQTAGSAVGAMADSGGQLASAFGLDANDALQPVNQRLVAEGKPPVTASQLEAATKDLVQDAVRQGRLDRTLLISNIEQNTALSRTDAEELATRIESQFKAAQTEATERLSAAGDTLQTGALEAADATGKAFWGVFGALFLGMIAAVGGGALGASRHQRTAARGRVPAVKADRKLGNPREVYP